VVRLQLKRLAIALHLNSTFNNKNEPAKHQEHKSKVKKAKPEVNLNSGSPQSAISILVNCSTHEELPGTPSLHSCVLRADTNPYQAAGPLAILIIIAGHVVL
jgi:hypothetical protein